MLIPLSPMDYYFLRRNLYTVQMGFEFEGLIDEERFRRAFAGALPYFPAVRSTLKILSEREAALAPLEPGREAELVCSQRLPADFDSRAEGVANRLIDPVTAAPGEALFRLKLSHTERRSYVGVSMSHLLGDGFAFFRFLTAISDRLLGRSISAPSNERSLLLRELAPEAPGTVDAARLFRDTGYIRPRPAAPVSSRKKGMLLSTAEIAELKKEAEAGKNGLTTNHVAMAELLRRFHTTIPLHDGKLILRCPVDYRKIHPGLAAIGGDYFGNAVRDAVAVFDPDRFPSLSLGTIAVATRLAIESITPDSVRASLACLRDLRLQEGASVFEDLGCPGLLVSNLTRMPIPLLHYGPGTPSRVIPASLNPRLAVLMHHPEGLDVYFQAPEKEAV